MVTGSFLTSARLLPPLITDVLQVFVWLSTCSVPADIYMMISKCSLNIVNEGVSGGILYWEIDRDLDFQLVSTGFILYQYSADLVWQPRNLQMSQHIVYAEPSSLLH